MGLRRPNMALERDPPYLGDTGDDESNEEPDEDFEYEKRIEEEYDDG